MPITASDLFMSATVLPATDASRIHINKYIIALNASQWAA
jgi:hypothetical protein